MISTREVQETARNLGVTTATIERDYVLGWLLWGIYTNPLLAQNLILKGGNCLRKVYFPQTRFSDDLDFSTTNGLDVGALFHEQLNQVCSAVGDRSGIAFDLQRTRVQEKSTPDADCRALEARVYFQGHGSGVRRRSVTMRIKFDISEYETIALPLQAHPLLHPYSDAGACQARVRTYSLEEVLAEKLRSWIQRTRPRDLYDIVTIATAEAVPLVRANLLASFLQKTIYKQVPLAGRDEMLYPGKFTDITRHWGPSITCPGPRLDVRAAIAHFYGFIDDLFTDAAAREPAGSTDHLYNVASGIREAIIAAGREKKLVRVRYAEQERDVEPYSFRFKRRDGREMEYFYGFDRTRGQRIKSFFLHKIAGVSILPTAYQPRWDVEF